MSVRRLVYLTNARLPTEKAHGLQICRMCESFGLAGLDVLLLHPRRRQPDARLREQAVPSFYGLRPVFSCRTLGNVDVTAVDRFLPSTPFLGLWLVHRMLWGLAAATVVRRTGPDLCFTRDYVLAWWLAQLRVPTVLEVHQVPTRLGRRFLRAVARQPSLRLTVGLTSFITEGLRELGFDPRRTCVLADGVDLDAFEHLPDREGCRARLGLPLDGPLIGYIGRFATLGLEKGVTDLVAAVARLNERQPGRPILLGVGGPMEQVPAYRARGERLGLDAKQLYFRDRVPHAEVPLWIRACDVVTIPSPDRPFFARASSPLKLFEYMASGVPIVASDLPALREVLRDRSNAILVPPGNPEALAAAIGDVLARPDLADRYAATAREEARNYSWMRRAQTVLSLAS